MCSITGFIPNKKQAVDIRKLSKLFHAGTQRGRDSFGFVASDSKSQKTYKSIAKYDSGLDLSLGRLDNKSIISNHRAEPTTEFVSKKSENDVQPFIFENGKISIAHNGTISNDKELAEKYGLLDNKSNIDTYVATSAILNKLIKENNYSLENIANTIIKEFKGSYAIALMINGKVLLINNYKPIYLNYQPEGIYFGSLPEFIKFHGDYNFEDSIKKLPPYSYTILDPQNNNNDPQIISFQKEPNSKVLVVCSGGLDSTTALKVAIDKFGKDRVALLHFQYNCNAQVREEEAVRKIVSNLGVELIVMPINIFGGMITESPILREEGEIQTYDKGVEFAYEWVPARNLVMMSFAIALAEAKGYGYIYLGNNLEESGAYPDNEMEFVNKLQELIPNAVADGYSLKIEQPVGNLMKHEIVKLGVEINAPLELTWSCYKNGNHHCGVCGPCRMRRVAYKMNNIIDPIKYEND